MSNLAEGQSPHDLNYAVSRRPNTHWLSLTIALIVPVLLPFFCALEFVEEPPYRPSSPGGKGYVLDDDTRLGVAIIGGILVASWLFAVVNLHNRWRRNRKTRAAPR